MSDSYMQINVSGTEMFIYDLSGISDQALVVLSYALFTVICQIIDLFGILTNIINIICFAQQGFTDSVNISLLGLSISDLGCLSTLVTINTFYTPAVMEADLPFDTMEVTYLVPAMLHLTFSRISSWITAVITLERCLCVTVPLKIKHIITPRRVSVVIICIFIVSFCSLTPVYMVNKLDMKFSPLRNKTIVGLVYNIDRQNVEKISFTINNFIMPFLAFGIIVICTVTLVIELKLANRFRHRFANKSQADKVYNRNEKVAKMVVMISILFIVCFVPLSVSMLALAFESELFSGRYLRAGMIIGAISLILESINSSVNIFIYYHMSSKYRVVCDGIMLKIGIVVKKNAIVISP